jgi:DNA-binding CsgD family transcriptional regulator
MAAIMLHNLGYIAERQGNPWEGLAYFAEALAEHVKSGDRQDVACCLGGIAGMVARLGQPAPAARLFGAAAELFESIGAAIWPIDEIDYERNRGLARRLLGDRGFAAAFAAGRALSLERAVAEAVVLAETGDLPSLTASAATDYGLTLRELEVLRLVAGHATDREIGDALSISHRTVMHHVSHILAKLGVTNRRAAAVFATTHDLG